MSSSDFRHIAIRTDAGKSERLFRAAVSAFCSLPRPTRNEIAQLEDLALPLFDGVSVESLRFVAAALCECEHAPVELVRRLCDLSVDVAAPLLIRSRALSDVDLIALIGRHGLPHARAIGRRKNLNPAIADLVRILERPALAATQQPPAQPPASSEIAEPKRAPGKAVEDMRSGLRAIMLAGRERDTATKEAPPAASAYARLRESALTGNTVFFQTALADTLDIDFKIARSLTACPDYSPLLAALRALDLSEDEAFLIAVAVFPAHFPHPQAIRQFLERYRLLSHPAALDQVRHWKAGIVPGKDKGTVRAS